MTLVVSRATIVRGFIFPTTEEVDFVSEIKIMPSISRRSKNSRYAELWVNLDRVETILRIEYPRIPEIMAQFSTILSGLLTIGIIIGMINNFLLKRKILENLKEIFFDNLSEGGNQKSKDPNMNKQKKLVNKEIEETLLNKCNVMNLVFEISKIQLAL